MKYLWVPRLIAVKIAHAGPRPAPALHHAPAPAPSGDLAVHRHRIAAILKRLNSSSASVHPLKIAHIAPSPSEAARERVRSSSCQSLSLSHSGRP